MTPVRFRSYLTQLPTTSLPRVARISNAVQFHSVYRSILINCETHFHNSCVNRAEFDFIEMVSTKLVLKWIPWFIIPWWPGALSMITWTGFYKILIIPTNHVDLRPLPCKGKLARTGQNRLVKIGQKWSKVGNKLVKSGQKWSKVIKSGQKWSKVAEPKTPPPKYPAPKAQRSKTF